MQKKTNKKSKKYIKGNYTKSQKIFVKILVFFRDILSIFRYGQVYVFDTNMLVANDIIDKRHQRSFTLTRNYWATETTIKEKDELLATEGYRSIFNFKLKELTFEKLREKHPNTCPLYYNYIRAMHNPAIVWGENFDAELIIKSLIKNGVLTKQEDKLNQRITTRLSSNKHRGVEQDEVFDIMTKANISSLSKKRSAIRKNDKNYFNDLKSLALSLLYCLQNKTNVTFVTSDRDFVNLILDVYSGVVQESAFTTKILPLLDDDIKRGMMSKKRYTFFLDSFEFAKHMENLMTDGFADNWKKDFVIFKIKYWNISTQKYTIFDFRFEKTLRHIFLNSHGTLFCPCSKNNENGNWISYMYWWPPTSVHNIQTLKVVVRAKNGIIKNDTFVDGRVHTANCRYPNEDAQGNLGFFSSFVGRP